MSGQESFDPTLKVLRGAGAIITCMACGAKASPHSVVVVGTRRGFVCSAKCADEAVKKTP